jgi:hypothetical protein
MAYTEYEYFQGKAHWAKLNTPDLQFNNWNVKVYLTPDSYDKFMKLREPKGGVDGILNEVRQEEDGYSVVFRRPCSKTWLGKETLLPPPIVVDKDGNPFSGGIGNGSDITVKCERYTYNKPFKKGKGTAIRMMGVRIDNLVPYERKDLTKDQEIQIKGIDEQKAQLF